MALLRLVKHKRLLAMLTVVSVISIAFLAWPRSQEHRPVNRADVVVLIDKLAAVDSEGPGYSFRGYNENFIALERENHFVNFPDLPHQKNPMQRSAIPLRKLVEMGVVAIPDLLRHLNDARPTSVIIGANDFVKGMWHVDLHCKGTPRRLPGIPNTEIKSCRYHVRIGDLCYIAVGQIVNRRYDTCRYVPSLCAYINSPVHNNEIAGIVRKEWEGLTVKRHRELLIRDLRTPWHSCGAILRLCYYYPSYGEDHAVRLLSRSVYERDIAVKRAQALFKTNPARWNNHVLKLKKDEGHVISLGVLRVLLEWYHVEKHQDEKRDLGKMIELINLDIPADCFPELDVATVREQQEIIDGLEFFPSRKVDQAIHNLSCSLLKEYRRFRDEAAIDYIILSCIKRMKAADDQLAQFCEKRIGELSLHGGDDDERIPMFHEALQMSRSRDNVR